MKTRSLIIASLAFVASLGSSAVAGTITLVPSIYAGGMGGGEITAVSPTLDISGYSPLALLNGGFETFCLEYNEHFSYNTPYNYTISSNAVGGDVPSGSDPLSVGTAWLYTRFAGGTLTNYDFTGGQTARQASARELQLAIWYLEDETQLIPPEAGPYGPGWSGPNVFLSQVSTAFGSLAAAKSDATPGLFGVWALNITDDSGNNKQSQLYQVPDNSATVALLGLALVGFAAFRRFLS
jgi:hypothetical protein